jgi:aspartate carbamoyltransferase regulatory subunit
MPFKHTFQCKNNNCKDKNLIVEKHFGMSELDQLHSQECETCGEIMTHIINAPTFKIPEGSYKPGTY